MNKSLVLHWNGTAWTRQASPSPSRAGAASVNTLSGVSAVSATDAWAAGSTLPNKSLGTTVILPWNGSAWTRG